MKSVLGTGFIGLLTLVFVIFKLLGKFDYSWWIVFSPLWIVALLFLVIGVIFVIILAFLEVFR
jgi:hypothetical protein